MLRPDLLNHFGGLTVFWRQDRRRGEAAALTPPPPQRPRFRGNVSKAECPCTFIIPVPEDRLPRKAAPEPCVVTYSVSTSVCTNLCAAIVNVPVAEPV